MILFAACIGAVITTIAIFTGTIWVAAFYLLGDDTLGC
jgi:hypothetical protein